MFDEIEKSSSFRRSDNGIRNGSLTPFLGFLLCYLPSQAGSPFTVVSSRFTFHQLSNPSGEETVPFSIVPAEVPGWLSQSQSLN